VNGRDNNFNFIRFVAASLVLFTHSYALATGSSQAEPLRATIGMTWGSIAVDIFFVTSGFLITGSYFARNNLLAFVWARVLRIYPALVAAILFCVFVVGIIFTTLSLSDYLSSTQTHRYFLKNITLFFGVDHHLPGVFTEVPFKGAVNGSLWTLPYEVKMYAILALLLSVISYLGKRLKFITVRKMILFIAIFSIGLNIFNHFQVVLPIKFVHLFSMFFVGAAYYVWRDRIVLSLSWALITLSLLLLSSIDKDIFFILFCFVLPYLVFYAAYLPAGEIRNFNKYGDYSYGIYIYAFPVQQSLAQMIPNITVSTMIALSFMVTLIFAFLSWHLIEKRFLKMKQGYVVIESFIQTIGLTRCFTWLK
jgi:peptidoglycan/LPS O-acetylase OafA/YrhL